MVSKFLYYSYYYIYYTVTLHNWGQTPRAYETVWTRFAIITQTYIALEQVYVVSVHLILDNPVRD